MSFRSLYIRRADYSRKNGLYVATVELLDGTKLSTVGETFDAVWDAMDVLIELDVSTRESK